MKQLICIGGGGSYESEEDYLSELHAYTYNPYKKRKKWRDWLAHGLSDTYEYISPSMPNKEHARYSHRKIWFEKIFPYLNNENTILVGSSLGAMFLLKRLSENDFPKHISQLHIVAPSLTDDHQPGKEKMGTFAWDFTRAKHISSCIDDVHVYYSKDDFIVSFENCALLQELLPDAHFHIFEDRGHFLQPHFVELFQIIKGGDLH